VETFLRYNVSPYIRFLLTSLTVIFLVVTVAIVRTVIVVVAIFKEKGHVVYVAWQTLPKPNTVTVGHWIGAN